MRPQYLAAIDWPVDFWIPLGFAAFGALLVVVPLWIAWRSERDRTRSKRNFVIDQFGYSIHLATMHIQANDVIPESLRTTIAQYAADIRSELAADSRRLHKALLRPAGRTGNQDDPVKQLHLLVTHMESGLAAQNGSADDLLAGLCLAAYLRVSLGLRPEDRLQDLTVLKSTYDAGVATPNREVAFLIQTLVDASPATIRDPVLAV